MQRGVIGTGDSFAVVDRTTQLPVSDAEALAIIDQLIDRGFSLRVTTSGELEGIQAIHVAPVTVSISRLR